MKPLRKIKLIVLYFEFLLKRIFVKGSPRVNLMYYRIRNWGDLINPELVSALGAKYNDIDIDLKNHYLGDYTMDYQLVIGSVLQHADTSTKVWGSGLISPALGENFKVKSVHAVRGPKTRAALMDKGIDCPEVYGDPALLMPYVFPNQQKKAYKLGIILHNDHSTDEISTVLTEDPEVLIISLRGSFRIVLDQILSCENIASSSLHGLIVPEAYGIPTKRLVLGNQLYGGDFKFMDYYQSINVEPGEPLKFDKSVSSKDDLVKSCSIKLLNIDLSALVEACPFMDQPNKDKLIQSIKNTA